METLKINSSKLIIAVGGKRPVCSQSVLESSVCRKLEKSVKRCNVKNDGGVLLRKKKSEKIAEMYIKKEKSDEKVLVKIKKLCLSGW